METPTEDSFEDEYSHKFGMLASKYGVSIKYERDRAGIDTGLHLKAINTMTNTRVWFQFKGLHIETFSLDKFIKADMVAVDLRIEHLRFWYRSPEAIYLVVYMECADTFLAQDVKTLIDKQWGDEILNSQCFPASQKTVRVYIPTSSKVNDATWQQMYNHSSMRTDGLSFRGIPLGHSHNPLNSILNQMEPALFNDLVNDLLNEHGFRVQENLDVARLFSKDKRADNIATLTCGTLPHQFEIKLQITNHWTLDEGVQHLNEGQSFFVKGLCAILIHSHVASCPEVTEIRKLARELKAKGIFSLLVFVNGYIMVEASRGYCGHTYIQSLSKTKIECHPQHLEDITFNFCVTTNTYYRFCDKVSWWGGALWRKDKNLTTI